MEKILMKGNDALAEAAVRAGCKYYFGYPITPQNEIPAYMSKRLPEVGGVFIQAESEIASINMVYGAAATGVRAMTSSSSPGVSLMQECLSYMAGAEIPCLVVNMMRGGPGLGNIAPSQADYLQSTKGGGHGDYNLIVLAPHTVQEIIDLTMKSFGIAFKYRNPVMLLADGVLAQMSEAVTFPDFINVSDNTDFALGKGGEQTIIHSLYLNPDDYLEKHNIHLQEKYRKIENELSLYEEYKTDDADTIVVAFGISARISKSSIDYVREQGKKVGLFRPITLWPFPSKELKRIAKGKKIVVIEMAYNQLEQDVKLATGNSNLFRLNRLGGLVFSEEEIRDYLLKI
jgi:2-oxoglutarate ferredoxin oxidoreductase subunit alpha